MQDTPSFCTGSDPGQSMLVLPVLSRVSTDSNDQHSCLSRGRPLAMALLPERKHAGYTICTGSDPGQSMLVLPVLSRVSTDSNDQHSCLSLWPTPSHGAAARKKTCRIHHLHWKRPWAVYAGPARALQGSQQIQMINIAVCRCGRPLAMALLPERKHAGIHHLHWKRPWAVYAGPACALHVLDRFK
jgi:hypothetical protein